MRINLDRIKIEYQDDRYFNVAFYIPSEQYPVRIWLSWQQWNFMTYVMSAQRQGVQDAWLRVGDFALTDGVNRYIEFYSDAIKIHQVGEQYPRSISFPFDALQLRIDQRITEIGPEEIERLRIRHWPRSRVIWDENVNKEVVLACWKELAGHVHGLRRIAKNHSDGQLCVVHMFRDGSAGTTMKHLEKGERPSFYWVIRRYMKLDEGVMDSMANWREDHNEENLHTVFLYGQKYIADISTYYKNQYYTDWGRIMEGGLIWHPNYKDPTIGSYGVHT